MNNKSVVTSQDKAMVGSFAFFPASQSKQELMLVWRKLSLASSSLYLPLGQFMHSREAVEEYVLVAQMLQDVLPCSAKFPASQSRQASLEALDEAPYFPASRDVHSEAPAGENFPLAQPKYGPAPSRIITVVVGFQVISNTKSQ